jgi:hypothetical protein
MASDAMRFAASGRAPGSAGRSALNWAIAIFAAGMLAGIAQRMYPTKNLGMGDGHEMVAMAQSLARNGTLGDPFYAMPTGPTAVESPLYPVVVAVAIRLFGSHPMLPYWVMIFVNIVVNAAAAALLSRVSALFFGTAIPGIAGGILAVAASLLTPAWDASFTQLGLILLVIGLGRLFERSGRVALDGAIAGAAVGLLFLLNSVSVLVSIPCVAFFMVRRAGPRDWLRLSAALVLAAVLVNLPWLVRNYSVWGRFVMRTNLGMTLYGSNSDCAQPSLAEEMNGCYEKTQPNTNIRQAEAVRRIGEPAYDRQRLAAAVSWTRAHANRFAWLTGMRLLQFWMPRPNPPAYVAYAVWLITILSLPGLVWMGCRRHPATLLFLVVFLLYPPVYYIVVSDVRYRVPILWLSCLCAGYFVTALSPRLRRALAV